MILSALGILLFFVLGLSVFINYPEFAKFVVFTGIVAGTAVYWWYILSEPKTQSVSDSPLMDIKVYNNGKSHQINGAYIDQSCVTVGKAENNDIRIDIDWLAENQFCIEKVKNGDNEIYYIENKSSTKPMYKVYKGKLSVLRVRTQLYSDSAQNCFRINDSNADNYIEIKINLP